MKTKIILIIVASLLVSKLQSQEFKMEVTGSKKIIISNLWGKLAIEGHSGAELLIKANKVIPVPELSDGLKLISSGGVENTGIGLSVNKVEDIILITSATKKSKESKYTILLPKNIALKVEYTSPFVHNKIDIKGISNEIEVQSLNSTINLIDITGPAVISSVNGKINANFTELSQKSTTSLSTVNGLIDITMPANTQADIEINSLQGDVYSNFDIIYKTEKKKKHEEDDEYDLPQVGFNFHIEGTLNGGGVDFNVESIHGSIYLRKK